MFWSQILAALGWMLLAAADSAWTGMPVIAEYSRETSAYASLMQAVRVVPLPDQSLVVLHLAPAQAESGITATILRPDGTMAAEWRAADWLRQAAQQTPGDNRLRTNPGQVGQIYGATLLPETGQLAVSIGWRDAAGKSENGIALVRATGDAYVAEKVFVLSMSVRDLAPGPGNTIVACVFNASAFRSTHRSPDLLILDTDGNAVGEASFSQPERAEDAARNNAEARVIALAENRMAFVTPGLGKAFFVRIEAAGTAPGDGSLEASRKPIVRTTVESVVNLVPPAANLRPATGRISVRAIHVDEQQRVGLVFSTGAPSRPTLTLVQNTASGASEREFPMPAGLRAAYWTDGRLQAVLVNSENAVVTAIGIQTPSR